MSWQLDTSARAHAPWHIDVEESRPPLEFDIASVVIVGFSPEDWAANHRHAHREALSCIAGELVLSWRDADGVRHEELMTPATNEGMSIFAIADNVPHLIRNRSSEPAVMCVWPERVEDYVDIDLEGTESFRG